MTTAAKHDGFDSSREVTLQINLSAGDAAYARLTVPALLRSQEHVLRRMAVVDCCRPQRTGIFDPERRSTLDEFSRRLSEVRNLAEQLKRSGLLDEIAYIEPGDPRIPGFASRYGRRWMTETHDYGGCAFMAYWAALDLPQTRFVLHYDADMLVHQDPGFSWVDEALAHWAAHPRAIAAVPRMSPPGFASSPEDDAPTLHEGRPKEAVSGGWLNDWFSTRCFLLDRARLSPLLPLASPWEAAVLRVRKLAARGYPPAPELLLNRSLGRRGWRCLNLGSEKAWLLHPIRKDGEYLRLLPTILSAVAEGSVPKTQMGHADILVDAWAAFAVGRSAT